MSELVEIRCPVCDELVMRVPTYAYVSPIQHIGPHSHLVADVVAIDQYEGFDLRREGIATAASPDDFTNLPDPATYRRAHIKGDQ
jgi:hypothetical protein